MRKIFFYGIFFLLQFALIEISLQVFYRVSNGDWLIRRVDLPMFEPDDTRVYRVKSNLDLEHTSNEFRVNYYADNFGFRSASPDHVTRVEKAPGVYRIAFLGPSFSFGTAGNFEDIYVTRIASQLREAGYDIEVINLGTPAQPVRWQLCWLEAYARDFDFDLIVQTVYGDPVITAQGCDKSPPLALIEDGRLYFSKPTLKKRVIASAKKLATVFYGWYLYQIYAAGDSETKGVGTDLYKETASDAIGPSEILAVYREYVRFVRSAVGPDPEIVFLFVPFSYSVHPEDLARFSHLGVTPPEVLRAKLARVTETLAESGIVFIDPLPKLLESAEDERQYNFIDVHFTPAGNATLADFAAPVIAAVIEEDLARDGARDP